MLLLIKKKSNKFVMLCYIAIGNCSVVMIISGLEKKSFVSVVFILWLRECGCVILLFFGMKLRKRKKKEQKGDFDVHFLSTRV